jgi:LmbE family N-acetylglucosaminyl deacetylase
VNILAIGAHPDDIELGCGRTLLKTARQGHNIYLYTQTQGGAAGQVIRRANELVNSAKFIGARVLWIDAFEDSKLYLTSDLTNNFEYFVLKSHADMVNTHSLQDNHHENRAIAEATLEPGRFSPNIKAHKNPSTRNFYPSIYYDISYVMAKKFSLIN